MRTIEIQAPDNTELVVLIDGRPARVIYQDIPNPSHKRICPCCGRQLVAATKDEAT